MTAASPAFCFVNQYLRFFFLLRLRMASIRMSTTATPNTVAEEMMPDEVKENPIAYPSEEVLANMETFNVLPDELNDAMDKAWSDMRGGNAAGNGWVIPVALAVAVVLIVLLAIRGRNKKKKRTY